MPHGLYTYGGQRTTWRVSSLLPPSVLKIKLWSPGFAASPFVCSVILPALSFPHRELTDFATHYVLLTLKKAFTFFLIYLDVGVGGHMYTYMCMYVSICMTSRRGQRILAEVGSLQHGV